MTAARTCRFFAQSLVGLALAAALLGAVQALTTAASASATYTAPTYGAPILDISEIF